MFEALLKSFERIFAKSTLRAVLFIALIVMPLAIADYLAGFSYYYNLGSQIEVVGELHELNAKGLGDQKDLLPLYESIVESLRERQEKPVLQPTYLLDGIPVIPLKFLSATVLIIPFFLYGLLALPFVGKDAGRLAGGSLILIILIGVPATLLPTLGAPWVNITVYFVLQSVILYALSQHGKDKKGPI